MPPQENLPNTGPSDCNPINGGSCSCSSATMAAVVCSQCAVGRLNAAFEEDTPEVTSERLQTVNLQDKQEKPHPPDYLQRMPSLSLDKPPPMPGEESTEGLMDFDDLLPYIGEFGIYQKYLFLFMIPFAFFVAFVYFSQFFMGLAPESHWCQVPELINANLSVEERMALSIPRSEDGVYDKCSQYGVNFTEVLAANLTKPDPKWPIIPCQRGWEFNFTDIPYSTIATELNWVCEQAALPNVAQSIFFIGAIFGGLIFGWLADRYGRIPALVGTNMVGAFAGIATAFVHSFWMFSLCRFLVGLAFDNCFVMMYILVLEYVGPKWRTFVANMSIAIFFTIAACILPWLALYLADWRMFTIATSAPLLLAIFTPWIVPESARWLISQGQIDRAIVILKKFERINKTHVDEKLYDKFREDCQKEYKATVAGKTYSVIDLFSSPRLRKITLLFIIIWMSVSLVFDGHVRNVGALGLDVFWTFTIASATEMPADTLLTLVLDHWGRRWLACGSMVASGVFSLLATTVPSGLPSATLAILGRFAVNISYNIGLQYAAEVLPTVVRAQGVALIHIMGYVASILAPFVVYLSYISPALPLIILGILGILGGALCLFLPETLDQELPQTLEDGEKFGLDQKFMDMPCRARRQDDEAPVKPFKRSAPITSSIRASIRGETLRSSMIIRDSVRSRRSKAADIA